MKKIIEKVAALINVKTVITFVVITVFAILTLRGWISPDNAMIIISMVVSFYFGTQSNKKAETTTAPVATYAEPVAVVPEQVAPTTESVDNATYTQIHPDASNT